MTNSKNLDTTLLAKQYTDSAKLTVSRFDTKLKTAITAINDCWYVFPDRASKYIGECLMLFERPDGNLEISVGDINKLRPGFYKSATLETSGVILDLLKTKNQNQHISLDPQKHYLLNFLIEQQEDQHSPSLQYSTSLHFDPK